MFDFSPNAIFVTVDAEGYAFPHVAMGVRGSQYMSCRIFVSNFGHGMNRVTFGSNYIRWYNYNSCLVYDYDGEASTISASASLQFNDANENYKYVVLG